MLQITLTPAMNFFLKSISAGTKSIWKIVIMKHCIILDFAHFLCVVRNSCTYTKTTIRFGVLGIFGLPE